MSRADPAAPDSHACCAARLKVGVMFVVYCKLLVALSQPASMYMVARSCHTHTHTHLTPYDFMH